MRYLFTLIFLTLAIPPLLAQDLSFTLSQERAGPGDSVRVCLSAKNFTDIISMQFTLTWDSSIISYLKVDDIKLEGVSASNFNEDFTTNGNLPFVWFSPNGEGNTQADGTPLFCLYFRAIGSLGDSSLLELRDQPTPIEIGRLDGGSINAIPLTLASGKVEIVDKPLEVEAQLNPANCFVPPDGSIQIQNSNGIPPFSYSWTGPNDFTATTKDLEQIIPGTYDLRVRDSLGRESTFSYLLEGPASALMADVNTNPTDCNSPTGSLQIDANGGTPPYRYDVNGESNATGEFNNLPAGEYLILISDANNCMIDVSASIATQTGGTTLDLGPDQLLCPGDSIVLSAPAGLNTYLWYQNDQLLGASENTISITAEGSYRLEASTADGCMVSDEVNIRFSDLGGAASGDTEIERGDSTQLNASDGENYQWSPATGLSCMTCPDPKAAPETTTTYFVNYNNTDGCPVMDSVVIRVSIPEDELRFVPVTFLSPNGDGENDELYFPGLESYQSNDLNVYSRWGQLVYSKIDYQIKGALWDGSLRGKLLPAGVYYYILRVDEQNISVKRHLTIAY